MLIDVLRIAACTAVLLYACILDWRSRRVANRVWYPLLVVGAILLLSDLYIGNEYLPGDLLISVAFTSVYAYVLFRLRLFGGADAKALMVLSFTIPQYPLFFINGATLPILYMKLGFLPVFAFTVLTNAVILTAVLPLWMLMKNLVRLGPSGLRGKWGLAALGYPLKIEQLKKPHLRLLYKYDEKDGKVTTSFSRHGDEVDDEAIHRLSGWHKKGLIPRDVWVTPQLPVIIPITLGFITALIIGDFMLNIMAALAW